MTAEEEYQKTILINNLFSLNLNKSFTKLQFKKIMTIYAFPQKDENNFKW